MSAVIEAPPRPAAAAPVAAPPTLPQQQEPAEQPNGTAASTSGRQQASSQASTAAAVQTGSRYCCYFVHRLLDFRVPELRALAELFGVQQQQLAIEPIPEGEVWVVFPQLQEHTASMRSQQTAAVWGTLIRSQQLSRIQQLSAGSCADLLVPSIVCATQLASTYPSNPHPSVGCCSSHTPVARPPCTPPPVLRSCRVQRE